MLTACKSFANGLSFILEYTETLYRFRWASLQLELLCAQKLDQDVRSSLGKLPPKLEQLYVEVYDRLMLYSGDAGRCIIDNTLKWLLSAQWALLVPEFLWAITINLSIPFGTITKETVLDLCHNLILYDEGLDTFRFAHLSVREFFEKRPDFSEVSCAIFAAESCLLHMIASLSFAGAESTLNDGRITHLRRRIASSTTSVPAKVLEYANDAWMVHCQIAPQNDRRDDASLGRIIQYFLLEHSGRDSAFDAWTQWYCNTILEIDAPTFKSQLQTILSGCSNSLSKWFFVAVAYGFNEVVDVYLQTEGLSEEEKSSTLLLAVMAAQHEIIDQLVDNEADWEPTEQILFYAVQNWDTERLARLLDKSTNVSLTRRMMAAASQGQSDRKITLLLEKNPDLSVTAEMLEDAMKNTNQDVFTPLLARASEGIVTESVLETAIKERQLKTFVLLLDRADDSCLTSSLIAHAVREKEMKPIMEVMLTRGGVAKITKEIMVEAAKLPDQEILNLLLLHGGVVTQEVLIGVAYDVSSGVLDALLEQGCEITGQILSLAAQFSWRGEAGLGPMLNRADEAIIAEEMDGLLVHVARRAGGTATMRQLLDREAGAKIPEHVLIAAARNTFCGSKLMQLFFEQGRTLEITADLLPYAVANLELEAVLPLLEHVETTGIIDVLLEAAAGNDSCGGELVSILLRRANVKELPERLLRKTMRNSKGTKVIVALEEVFGRIEITEDKMVTLVREARNAEILSGWMEPALITEKVLISALSNRMYEVRNSIVENSLHLPVTIAILKAAAPLCDLPCFRLLWNRGRIAKVTEDLVKKVAENYWSLDIIQFLLDEAEEVQTGEEFIMAVAEKSRRAVDIFNLLVERGVQLEITYGVLKAAVLDRYWLRDPLSWILQRHIHLEITEELFKIAASEGNKAILHRLSEYCKMESTPKKWLDIARIIKAAWRGEADSLKDLKVSGTTPRDQEAGLK